MKNLIRFALAGALLCMAGMATADTTTSRMGLVKPTIGSTGWGVKINNDMDVIASTAAALYASNVFKSTNQFDGATIFSLSAIGQMPYMGASGLLSFLASGTTGYVLQSGGNAAPSWISLASAGGVTGTGANTRVAYWTGTSTVGSIGTFTFNGSTLAAPTVSATNGSFTQVTGGTGSFGAVQPSPAGGSLVFQSTTGNVTATLYSTGTLAVNGSINASGFIASDLGVGVGVSTGLAGFNAANSTGQTMGVGVGDVTSATASFAGASVIQSTVPVRIITDPTLTTAALVASGTQIAVGNNSVVGNYSVATASGVFVSGAGSNSLVEGNLSVGGILAATTITGSGAGITSISGSNVAGGTFGAVNGAALTALTAANITAGGTLPALNGAALTALTAANITAAGTLPALNGAALTSLTAANVTGAGALPDSVLSSNVPRLNANNAFSGSNSITQVQVGTTTSGGVLTVAAVASQTNTLYLTHGGATPDIAVSTNGVIAIQAGSGTATFSPGGILDNLIVSSGTNSGSAAETTLYSYNLPANTFVSTAAVNGAHQVLYIFAGGTTANATLERVRIYFGGTTCADSGNVGLNGTTWKAECWISQTGTGATQAATGSFIGGTATLTNSDTTPTETISGTINIKITGTVQVATTNGVLVRHAYVKKE